MAPEKKKIEWDTYFSFILKEISELQLYINAAIIGFIICFFTGKYSLVPFIVPLFVQVLSKSKVKYQQRHLNALVELPAQAEDPVFIMDTRGSILLSVGKTFELFEQRAVTNIKDFLSLEALEEILNVAGAGSHAHSTEAFSGLTMKWYKIKATRMGQDKGAEHILVWFQDISLRKTYDFRLQDLLRYSSALMQDLADIVDTGEEFEHLSSFLLKDYEAVFITRADQGKNLSGYVFKQSETRIERSCLILIHNESPAPINISRKEAQIISDDMEGYGSEAEFLEKNPLDPRVLDFIGGPIHNFITYNEADLSIIAFNYKSKISDYEKRFFEILVNNYRTIIMLVDLEKKRKQQS
ncbi:MAG: hypothetical protein HUN04_12150 [Desulfobacter sp.]|nr:MAG: hypothetical protein HUN04_12150 [Desulfobacter sp.]